MRKIARCFFQPLSWPFWAQERFQRGSCEAMRRARLPVAGAAARINLARPAASAPSRWSQPQTFVQRIPQEFNRRQSSWILIHLFLCRAVW
jgi:hypothetical protein